MQYMNDKCKQWKAAENMDYSLYGTPIESTTYKFAKCLQKRFGVIKGITDKGYITNSYHVHVTEEARWHSSRRSSKISQNLSKSPPADNPTSGRLIVTTPWLKRP